MCERILLLRRIGIERVVIGQFPGNHHLDRGNAQRVVQVFLGRLGDHGIACRDVIRKRIVAHVEFGQVDIDAPFGKRLKEFGKAAGVVRVTRLQVALQSDGMQRHAGMLQLVDQL